TSEETIPIIIDQEIPFAVVFFQKRRKSIAGKLADAAIANAQPTKNETFIPLNDMPNAIAKTPTNKAEILPALTFCLSVKFFLRYPSIKSCAIAPEDATINPETVPKTVAKAIAEMTEKRITPKERAKSGAAILLDSTSITPF